VRYRLHYTHPDGMTTTGDYEGDERDLAVGDVLVLDGKPWRIEEIEPFDLEEYSGYVAVSPAESDGERA
jgi:hypothetical protein